MTRLRPLPPATRALARRARFASAALLLAAGGCGAGLRGFGPDEARARANAEQFFGAMSYRMDEVERHPRFAYARARLGRYALAPSKLWGDTAVWTSSDSRTRTLQVHGVYTGRRYVFTPRAGTPFPVALGESRHTMRLTKVDDEDAWRWNTSVEMAMGSVRADDLLSAWRGWLAAAQRGEAGRADWRLAAPRATAAFGRLATVDTLRAVPHADGSATVSVVVRLHPDGVAAAGFPNFGEYLKKYVRPAGYAFAVTDAGGGRWLEADAKRDVVRFRFRTIDGRLAPMSGPVRPMPQQLVVSGHVFGKFGIFGVGVRNLVADFTVVAAEGERGWQWRFRREPDWDFPLAVNRLMNASLRRPFEGEGTGVRLTLRDGRGGQSILHRNVDAAVRESRIVRWIGNLAGDAMNDFAGKAEAEENRFLHEGLDALRLDARALRALGDGGMPARAVGSEGGSGGR